MARYFIILSTILGALGASAQQQPPEQDFVVVCHVNKMIDEGIAVIVERAVRESANASAIVFKIDTLGGRVDSALRITDEIMSAKVPTIAWITGEGAISAGALIAYACDHILMAPGQNIGASTPFTPGADAAAQVTEKSMSFLRAKYRALGEENGHNPLLGEAMVDPDVELWGVPGEDGAWTIHKVERGDVVESVDSVPEPHRQLAGLDLRGSGHAQAPNELERTLRRVLGDPAVDEETEEHAEEDAEEAAPPAERPGALPPEAVLISSAGKLLTLTSGESLKFGLIPATAGSIDEALAYYGLEEPEQYLVIPTWAEELFRFLTSPMISSLLLMLGLGGLYLEIRTPGFGLAGLIGVTCLALFFGSYLVIGMAEWVELLLVAVGVSLILLEVFVLPGFGIPGIAGFICLLAGTYLALTHVNVPEFDWDYQRIEDAGRTVALGSAMFVVFAIVSWRYFPHSPLARTLVFRDEQLAEQGYVAQDASERQLLGHRGIATSVLRPAGRGRFGGRNIDIMTRGEYIEAGTPIEVIQVEGNRIVVAAVETNEEQA